MLATKLLLQEMIYKSCKISGTLDSVAALNLPLKESLKSGRASACGWKGNHKRHCKGRVTKCDSERFQFIIDASVLWEGGRLIASSHHQGGFNDMPHVIEIEIICLLSN